MTAAALTLRPPARDQRLDGWAGEVLQTVAAEDLAGLPVYVVECGDLPPRLGRDAGCLGFTARDLDLALVLAGCLAGRWRGRGPTMAVNAALVADAAGEPEFVHVAYLGVALHELAHAIAAGWPAVHRAGLPQEGGGLAPVADRAAPTIADQVTLAPDRVTPATDPDDERSLLVDHGPRFVRAALHLRHRAEAAGLYLSTARVVGYQSLGPHPERFRVELGDEPAKLSGLAIGEILETPPPEGFSAWWAECVGYYRKERAMSIGSILSKLTASLTQRERSRGDTFKKVVRDICDGKEPAVERVEPALAEAGKTPDDLAAEVARVERRRELAVVVAREPEIERELKAIDAEAKRIDADLDKALARAVEAKQPLEWQEARLKEERRKVEPAKDELVKTADPDLHERLRAVEAKLAEAWVRRNRKAKLLADTKARKEELLSLAAKSVDGGELQKEYRRDAADRDQGIAAHTAALAEIDAELAGLKAEEAAIRREMLEA